MMEAPSESSPDQSSSTTTKTNGIFQISLVQQPADFSPNIPQQFILRTGYTEKRVQKIKIKLNKRLTQSGGVLDVGDGEIGENEYYVETSTDELMGLTVVMDKPIVNTTETEHILQQPEAEPEPETEMVTESDDETSDCDNNEGNEEMEGDSIIDDSDLNQDESLAHKTFKERATELMRKTQGENSHLVQRILTSDDWLFIHRIIRKSKGLKSKFMMKNLSPFLFDAAYVESWKCKFCKEMISAPTKEYIAHFGAHSIGLDEDPLFPCDVCGDYVKKDKYVVHWVPHFMEHECPICKKTFALNCHMRYHYKVVHEEGEQTCFQCGKLMKNDLAMRRHIRLFHSNRTNWKICDICGKCVKSRCLEPHKLTHSQDRPYKCDTCKKCFKTPSTLYQHQKVHATDSKAHKYLCEYCGKRFKHHTSWNLHVVRIHEGEYEHECTVCHKRFHKLFELKKHSVKHSEDRPFPCKICFKGFKTSTHLKEHVTIHSEEKNHVCPLCGKGIRMKANLYKHLKVHRNRGEYVPPLNGNSTNLLFNNNYGFPSSMNSISNTNTNCGNNNKNSSTLTTSNTTPKCSALASTATSSTVCRSDDTTTTPDSNKLQSTSSVHHLAHNNDNANNATTTMGIDTDELATLPQLGLIGESSPDLIQNAQLHLPVESQIIVNNINNLNVNNSIKNQDEYNNRQIVAGTTEDHLTQDSISTLHVADSDDNRDLLVQGEVHDSASPTQSQSQYQPQIFVFDPNTSTILNLQGAQFSSRKTQLHLQPKYECTIMNGENGGNTLSGHDNNLTFSTSDDNNSNNNPNNIVVDLGSVLHGEVINTLGLGNISFHHGGGETTGNNGNYSPLPAASLNHISIPNNIISLLAPSTDNIRINGNSITHFTIMVNHNSLNGLTLSPVVQSD